MTVFQKKHRLSMGDCDPAGIVFHPRYLEMINLVVEDWFDDGMGINFAEMHLKEQRGVPAVAIATEFPAPGRMGDVLLFTLKVRKLGNSSIGLSIDGTCGDRLIVSSKLTLVYMNLESARPEPLPDDLRAAITAYLAPSGESP